MKKNIPLVAILLFMLISCSRLTPFIDKDRTELFGYLSAGNMKAGEIYLTSLRDKNKYEEALFFEGYYRIAQKNFKGAHRIITKFLEEYPESIYKNEATLLQNMLHDILELEKENQQYQKASVNFEILSSSLSIRLDDCQFEKEILKEQFAENEKKRLLLIKKVKILEKKIKQLTDIDLESELERIRGQ